LRRATVLANIDGNRTQLPRGFKLPVHRILRVSEGVENLLG
jgi:hypothetical protein